MLRIVVIAAVIAVSLFAIKEHHVLQRSGLLGYCSAAPSAPGETGSWRACRKGKLSGEPDLSQSGCTRYGAVRELEYWHCPAAVESNFARQ